MSRPKTPDHERGPDQRDPEALGEGEQEEAEVRPQHVERAVGEVHHGHQPEDEREPRREEDEDPPQDEAREDLCEKRRERDVGHGRTLDVPLLGAGPVEHLVGGDLGDVMS